MNKYIKYYLLSAFLVLFGIQIQTAQAQSEESPSLSAGMDLVSTYIWRGVAYSGPSIQPTVELSAGGFAIGAWGSQGFDGFQEMDLYAGYSFDFGLSLGVTDYFYPDEESRFFDDLEEDAHAFELNGSYTVDDLSLSANYIFARGGSYGDDLYFEVRYTIGKANLFVGGGDGWHVNEPEDGFQIVNVGISTSKEVKISDSFSFPVFGALIVNPDAEKIYITAGLSL